MAEACATSVAKNLALKVGEYLFASISRQFGYVLCYKSYVEDLKDRVKELETVRERVQHLVDEAVYDGKPIYTDIKNWLESVENKAKEVENLLKHGESAKISCFRGWLPNPVVLHPIGRKVKKMTRVIQGLHEKSPNSNFQKVFYENTPIGIVTDTTFATISVDNKEDILDSRASIIHDLMKAIANDKVFVVGVYGPGGVGKSKLLEDIERQVKEEKLFDVVARANISRNPDLKTIQGEIAYALGLKIMNEETTHGRAYLLRRRLESDPKKKILIILDNLWKKVELKEVGIPCGDDNKVRGCKLLLTSRYRDVLLIDMGSDREFRLNELKHGEAQRIFERTMGDRVNDPNFKPLVDGVVKNCGGLPLLIISLAKRLKHGDLAAWRNALTNIEPSDVKSIVELNYNDLKDERIKSFQTIENTRDRFIMDLQSLQDSSLVLDSENIEQFRMHDIFVELAISIASTEWNALVGRKDYGFKDWSKDELRKCTAISFPHVGIDDLPEKLDCPNLRILLLLESHLSLEIPESFFESMEKLQVLDTSGFSFTSLPSSTEFLKNLKSLCLEYCHLEDLTVIGKLKGLQFLSLYRSAFTRLPKEIGELKELKYLGLSGCTKLKVIEPGVLESLVNLEELYIEDSFDQWEAEDEAPRSNASLVELKNMKKLSTLYIAVPHSANLSRDLPFMKLNKHKIQVGDVWDWSGEYKESRTLKLKLDLGSLLLEDWMQRCLQITEDLHLDGMQDGNDSIHDLCVEGFQELKHLHVQRSPSLQYIIHFTENVPRTAFSRLESLFLKNLNNMEKICHGCLTPESFSKLKIVKVDNCGEIKHLFPLSMKRIFLQLEEIEISRCHLMQQIIANAEADEDGEEIDDDPKVQSCNVRMLTLRNLPEMTSFWKTMDYSVAFFNGQQVSLPQLESLTLSELPKLKEIWSSQFPLDVSNLKFLKVEDCTFLLSIIPSNILLKLRNLEAITIERCHLIREVFDLEGLIASDNVKILSRLTKVTLSDLPSMGCIWNKNPRTLCFQNLRSLKVQNCEKLRFLFSSSMAKGLGQIKEIEIVTCKLMEEIMDAQEEESEEDATTNTLEFPLLTSLSLEKLPNLMTFSYGKCYISCPSLTRLRISGCPKMMTFSLFEGKQ
ncbi:disease resistance protein At4g27190-like [Eucalyptus grandis]|uniref:disease resistance protein At4g27190-like n=1 Tax=Eucalyptus grandis TaxID=71139 RepID=UPI00192E7E5A|nr:disease resistance protein At4g27190-like [Eucalyptus grandis]